MSSHICFTIYPGATIAHMPTYSINTPNPQFKFAYHLSAIIGIGIPSYKCVQCLQRPTLLPTKGPSVGEASSLRLRSLN
jgi:hypothetical protein